MIGAPRPRGWGVFIEGMGAGGLLKFLELF